MTLFKLGLVAEGPEGDDERKPEDAGCQSWAPEWQPQRFIPSEADD